MYHQCLKSVQPCLMFPAGKKLQQQSQLDPKSLQLFWTWELLPPIYHWSLIFNAALYYCLFIVSKAPVSKMKRTLAFVANDKFKMKTAPGKNQNSTSMKKKNIFSFTTHHSSSSSSLPFLLQNDTELSICWLFLKQPPACFFRCLIPNIHKPRYIGTTDPQI